MSPDVKLTVSSGLVFCTGTGYVAGPSASTRLWSERKVSNQKQLHRGWEGLYLGLFSSVVVQNLELPAYFCNVCKQKQSRYSKLICLLLWSHSIFSLHFFTAAQWFTDLLLSYPRMVFYPSLLSTAQSWKSMLWKVSLGPKLKNSIINTIMMPKATC